MNHPDQPTPPTQPPALELSKSVWCAEAPNFPGYYAAKQPVERGKLGEEGTEFGTYDFWSAIHFPTAQACQDWIDKNSSPAWKAVEHGFMTPAPLAGGTEVLPSTVPAEVAAGCKEGRPVSPATGEREAELRGLITDVLAVTPKITSTFSFEEFGALTNGLVFVLTPLLDRREGELAAQTELAASYSRSLERQDKEFHDLRAQLTAANAHMDKLREHRNDLDAACHELEGKLAAAQAEIARLTEQEAEEQHKTSYALGYKDGWRDGRLPLNNPTIQ